MPISAYPAGVSTVGGLPVIGVGPVRATGNVFFVDSTDSRASSGASAGDRATPCSTVQSAINKCVASNGDIIFVLPGHTEIIDGDINLSVAGVTVMGLGPGGSRPTFDFLAAGDTITVTAAGCRISNIICQLDNSAATVTAAFTIAANGTTIDNCRILPHATSQFTSLVTLGDFNDCIIGYNSFYSLATASSADGIIITGTAERAQIFHNVVDGHFTNHAIGSTAAVVDIVIANNVFRNANTSMCIDMDNSATGMAANNAFSTGAAAITQDTGYDFGDLLCNQNYMVNAVDETGGPIPTTAAT